MIYLKPFSFSENVDLSQTTVFWRERGDNWGRHGLWWFINMNMNQIKWSMRTSVIFQRRIKRRDRRDRGDRGDRGDKGWKFLKRFLAGFLAVGNQFQWQFLLMASLQVCTISGLGSIPWLLKINTFGQKKCKRQKVQRDCWKCHKHDNLFSQGAEENFQKSILKNIQRSVIKIKMKFRRKKCWWLSEQIFIFSGELGRWEKCENWINL